MMRNDGRWRWVVVTVFGLLVAWWTHALGQPQSETDLPPQQQKLPPGCLQVVSDAGGPITAIVYDANQRVLGVYHVDRATGEIELKSIRQIEWDLRMQHYNGKEPLPEAIRNGLVPR